MIATRGFNMRTMTPMELLDSVPDPVQTVAALDEYIIGQAEAKRTLALMMMYRALIRLKDNNLIKLDTDIPKANVLLLGPTGTGKTALMRALSEIMDIPISINDITSVTSAGYIGGKVEDILVNHVNVCNEYVAQNYERLCYKVDLERVPYGMVLMDHIENGIIYIDEIDKICKKSNDLDVSGDLVQNELLKILESGKVNLGNSRMPLPSCGIRSLQTQNISFVCGGAFSGLSDIIYKRTSKSAGIGFGADMASCSTNDERMNSILSEVTTQDLIDYGFKAEFLGRVPLRACLKGLDVPTLEEIIIKPRNSILNQYLGLFKAFGVNLVVEKEAMHAIAEKALAMKMGARSLQHLFNNVFSEYLFNIFSHTKKKIIIKKEHVL